MNKSLFLFVGRSASGKTTVANMLERDGYNQIQSYTTRPPRYQGETGHTFISKKEYDKLDNIVASTLYNGYHYCTTLEQIQNADIYVIDVPGVITLLNNYEKIKRPLHVIYFEVDVYNRIQRMLERHDSDTQIVSRLLQDEKSDWLEDLLSIESDNYNKIFISTVDANHNLQNVYQRVKYIVQGTVI